MSDDKAATTSDGTQHDVGMSTAGQDVTATTSLDALFSPSLPPDVDVPLDSPGVDPRHSLNEAPLDEETRFSTITLGSGTRDSTLSDSSRASSTATKFNPGHRNLHSLYGPDSPMSVAKRILHKKSASTTTISSISGVPFMLQRLDAQMAQEEMDPSSNRSSLDGQQKIQEEFSRLQVEHDGEAEITVENEIDWDFWGEVISDYRQYASDNPEKLAKAIENGIPNSLRGMMWQLMSASKDPNLEAEYQSLLKQSSPHEKAILRDLGRTFPHHEFFTDGQGIGQENLFNVLKAYSLYDNQVGYCQGLPFVVAVLLLNMPDEEAFCLLVRLMQSYDLRGHFLPEMPSLQLRLYQFDRLVEELLPVLHVHFLRQGVKSTMFCSQWFLTMFSYRFPLDIVFRIYDNVLATGIEAIFGFSMALLQKNEEALLSLKFDDILAFLKTRLFEKYSSGIAQPDQRSTQDKDVVHSASSYKVDEFVQDATQLRITPFMLDAYAHEHEEQVRVKEAHAVELETLRNLNRQLSTQVQTLETTLTQLNDERVEIVKELVMQRLRNEEMESELVTYKLLYADAMHQNEDARSSHRMSNPLSHRSGRSGH